MSNTTSNGTHRFGHRTPCPFCGTTQQDVIGEKPGVSLHSYPWGYQVECTKCGAKGPWDNEDPVHAIALWDARANPPAEKPAADDLQRLRAYLHSRCLHPDYEYATTTGQRKGFDEHAPEGDGWERNTDAGNNGWARFEYHEEAYWRRLKPATNTNQ